MNSFPSALLQKSFDPLQETVRRHVAGNSTDFSPAGVEHDDRRQSVDLVLVRQLFAVAIYVEAERHDSCFEGPEATFASRSVVDSSRLHQTHQSA